MSYGAPLYPLFLKLADRPCLVVGAGAIGAQKCAELLEAGARVRLISPDRHPRFDAMEEEHGERLHWEARRWRPGDCEGAYLVISATGDSEVDVAIEAEARAERALLNVVDVVDRCDFYAGAVVRRGPIQISISTGGASPSIAIWLRRRIEAVIPAGLDVLAAELARVRPQLLERFPDYGERAARLRHVVAAGVQELARAPREAQPAAWVDRVAACGRPCEGPLCACVLEEAAAQGAAASPSGGSP